MGTPLGSGCLGGAYRRLRGRQTSTFCRMSVSSEVHLRSTYSLGIPLRFLDMQLVKPKKKGTAMETVIRYVSESPQTASRKQLRTDTPIYPPCPDRRIGVPAYRRISCPDRRIGVFASWMGVSAYFSPHIGDTLIHRHTLPPSLPAPTWSSGC